MIFAAAGFLSGMLLFLCVFLIWRRREAERIKSLTEYLRRINAGKEENLFSVGEDELSRLQDEMYKTVTELYQTRDAALKAKNNFAENLANIAHQLKTPITAISLSVQMLKENPDHGYSEQIEGQLARLAHMEEALLLLSRIDAGTLSFEREAVDVYTLLVLAADNLQELLLEAEVSVVIPEAGEMWISADLDWTMEAVMNLFKNCMEHTPPGGSIYCAYEQNPLYTRIRIRDTGSGFDREELPHLFRRFYRGKGEKGGGIGIGLPIAREIIERQNGVLAAENSPEGGACFEIRLYSH